MSTDGRHEPIEEASIELHRAIAKRLLAEPALVEFVGALVLGTAYQLLG